LIVYWAQKTDFVPIYNNLAADEAGEIMEQLDSQGVSAKLSEDGSTIYVPEKDAARLKVELSYQGITRSGNINYGIFSENMGLGMTDRQFDVIERDAMQGELSALMEQIDGIDRARVLISRPQESVFITDEDQNSSASVVVKTSPGVSLNQSQINGLYHL